MADKKLHILIVEDDDDMAQLNARLLTRRGYRVTRAGTAAQAREMFTAGPPDLLMLDVGLPDGDGLELCAEFQEISDAPVLFLTGKSTIGDKVSGLESGGDYYLTKPFDHKELIAVIQSLLRRREQVQEKIGGASVISIGLLTLNLIESKAYNKGKDLNLSPKEFALLHLLVQNKGRELTYETIYEKIWGMDMMGDSRAVRQQISRLKKKLDEENAEDFAIFNEHGIGYTFVYLGDN